MTGVLVREVGDRDTGRMAWHDRGGHWSDAPKPATAEVGRGKEGFQGEQSADDTLILDF